MQRCSQPIPCSTFNNDGSIFAYAVCSICCFLKPYLFTYAVLYFLLHFLWHSSINKETYICWCIRSAWDAFFASIIEVTSSLLCNSHSGFLITCTISSVSSLSFFLYLPPSSFSFFSISLSRAREKRYKRSNLYPSQGQVLFLCFCNKFVFQYYSYIVISYSSLGRVIITL